jgi:hypothetical protein
MPYHLATADTRCRRAAPSTGTVRENPDRALARAHGGQVKVYDLGGHAVFSTDPTQIGETRQQSRLRRRARGAVTNGSRIATRSAD